MHKQTDSEFLQHIPCSSCGSSDANTQYTDGHTYCFSCGAHSHGEGGERLTRPKPKMVGMIEGTVSGLLARHISKETCAHFGYTKGEYKNHPVQIAPYYNTDGQLVAQKVRYANKDFQVTGDIREALPFGANVWPKKGKMIVVTEGEIDALSMSQVQGNAWPVVSISCGAGPQIRKYFARHREYFLGFDKVILMFDMDEPGRKAAKIAAEVIGAKAHIAELPLKDPNDMLCAGRTKELITAMWQAKEYRPEGIVDMAELKDAVMEHPADGLSWPFETLTRLTYGVRLGELYALGAGTGVGKTDFFCQTIRHFAVEHKVPVGVFSLEQHPRETATRIAGKMAQKPLHIPDGGWTDNDFETAWAKLMESGKIFLYDSFGNNDWEIVKQKIEYLYHEHGVKYFFLDHLTALAAWQEDERKALVLIMSDLGSVVNKLNCSIFFVSHLATPEGKPHEEGGRVMIRHFKGARDIGYWSHYMFALERNQQADSEAERQTTTFRVLKDRFTGRATGEVFFLGYDHKTGMLYETDQPMTAENHGFTNEEEF